MRWQNIWLRAAVATGLVVLIGGAGTARAQSTPAAATAQAQVVTPTSFTTTTTDDSDNDSPIFTPLPPVQDGSVTTAGAQSPFSQASTNSRVAELEAKVAELDAQLQKDKDKKAADDKAGYLVGSDTAASGKWLPDGLTFTSKNGDFKSHIRGVAQLDYVALRDPSGGIVGSPGIGTQDVVNFRRLRLGAEGTMYEWIDYVYEFDFAFALQNVDQLSASTPSTGLRSFPTGVGQQAGNVINAIQPTTIFLTFKEVPLFGNIRVGNQQNWISLEHIESARFLDFMERSPLMDAFNGANNNGYAPGISAFRMTNNQKAALEIGAYANNMYNSGYPYTVLGKNAFIYGGRTHWTPYYDEISNGRYMLHVGVGGEFRTFDTETTGLQDGTNVRVRTRGDLRNGVSVLDPNFADTGNFFAANQSTVNPELAFQWGSLLVQAEYNSSNFGGAAAAKGGTGLGNVRFQGGYCEALYFLTGENRIYNRQSGVFNRVIPIQNANIVKGAGFCGWGAWQVGARVDWLDLNSGLVNGGNLTNYTLGLNWFINPNVRFQFNYVYSMIDGTVPATFPGTVGSLNGARFGGHGNIDSFGCRMDYTF